MLDGGYVPATHQYSFDEQNFEDIRTREPDQWKVFLGEDFSSIPLQGLKGGLGGGMVSGNRAYVVQDADALQPLTAGNAQVIQSLARGGLGAAWGAACAYLEDEELCAMGLPAANMQQAYDDVSREIGISGPATRACVQPAAHPDLHASLLLEAAEHKQARLRALGVRITQPHSAVLTVPLGDRQPTRYTDMDYYLDPGRSVYRPQYTLDTLKTKPNFLYLGGHLVERIEETAHETRVHAHVLAHGKRTHARTFSCQQVVMAAGAVNTARILLRSFTAPGTATSFIGKPHVFSAVFHPRTLGKAGPAQRLSLCQLLALDEHRTAQGLHAGAAQLYGYRSMLLFRLLGNVPLPVPEAMTLLSVLSPSLLVADIRFPGLEHTDSTLSLDADGHVSIRVHVPPEEHLARTQSLQRLHRGLRALGAWTLKTMPLPEASTSHHAGTVPVEQTPSGRPLSVDPQGKLHQAKRVFVADASMFRCLPPSPHTLTIMANARRVGQGIALSAV
jgi:hypothetical protein